MFSQLYVSPNGSTDSYIYVNDSHIFVEEGINLTLNNNDPTLKASIYLREESQLLQGLSNTPNSGTGYISVFQETPDDDSWDYSIWNSPVGNYILGSGNENFGANRIHDSLSVTNSIISQFTPTHNGIESPLTISTRWLYMFTTPANEAEANYTRIYTNDVVPPEFGFIMKGVGTTNHEQRYDFRGRAKNGEMSVPVENNKKVISGNPYPSAIDLKLLFNDNSNLATLHYWDEDRTIDSHYYSIARGGFGSWVPGAPDPIDPNGIYVVPVFKRWDAGGNSSGNYGSGSDYNRRYSPIGQGIYFTGNSTGTVTLKNDYRVYVKEGNSSIFRRPIDSTDLRSPQARIYATFGESHSREMVLAFSEFSTDNYDQGMDGKHPDDINNDIYFPIENEKYIIQFVPFQPGKKIPITFEIDQQFTVTIKVTEIVNIDKNAFIWDNVAHHFYQINNDNEFNITLPAGVYDNRFFVVFKGNNRESITENELEMDINVNIFQNNSLKQLEIHNIDQYHISDFYIYDISGKIIINESNLGNNSQININTNNISSGAYIVKYVVNGSDIINRKIIIQ
tara:strand:+ start:5893 stop:7587 length:1695 start_codon:yes stop_codon:yes gene_type:complete